MVPISAQLELFPNGDYIARSNLVERSYKRVNPDDFDDDGIPNDIDANPSVSDGTFFGPDNDLPEGANSNNYCWVDVVVSNANSLVTFIGEIRMIPPSLVGTFNWNTNTCCVQVQTTPSELPKCAWDCTCEGCTLGGFTFDYEGYSLNFGGIGCGCIVAAGKEFSVDFGGIDVAGMISETRIPVKGEYSKTDYNVSAAGFFPGNHPQWVVAIGFSRPNPDHSAGRVALPVFSEIVRKMMSESCE